MKTWLFKVFARVVKAALVEDTLEEARIDPVKPYKRRLRLKQDPINMMRRRLYKLTTRDPKIQRQRKLTRKLYLRKNKQLLKRRAEFVRKAQKRLPPKPGGINPKRSSTNPT